MGRHRFILPELSPDDGTARIRGALLPHARARRLRIGEKVELSDGCGLLRAGIVVKVGTSEIDLELAPGCVQSRDSTLDLTLAIAWLKGSALEDVVEKVSELGVRRLWLFDSDHSIASGSPHRRERLERVAQEAAVQCGRGSVLEIVDHNSFKTVIEVGTSARRILFSEPADDAAIAPLHPVGPLSEAAVLVILGPEGGFSDAERNAARAQGLPIMTLGPRILRASTAAVVAAASCQLWWGDLAPRGDRPTIC